MTPMTSAWEQIIGHEWAVDLLNKAIEHNRIGHAYLITGPAHIGKTTLAHTFAQALNCREANAPCGICRTCKLIGKGRHPDIRLVEPEVSGRGKPTLKIDQMRELQQSLNLASYEAQYKVAIITEFNSATIGAANAFLKTLEEPPSNVILILTATDADTLLPTITSRCRTLALRAVPAGQIQSHLIQQHQLPPDQAQLIAHLADGRLGWALDAAQNPALLDLRQTQLDTLQQALQGTRVDRFQLAEKLAKSPETLIPLLQTWLSWWRDLTLLAWQQSPDFTLTNLDQQAYLTTLATTWDRTAIQHALKQTKTAIWQLNHNTNTRLTLENLFLAYPSPN